MIQLDQNEKQWILLCKGQLKDKYPFTGLWCNTLKPLFIEIYGWNPDENNNYKDYLWGVFDKLLDIFLKINDDQSGSNKQLKEIFSEAFYKKPWTNEEQPIERAIHRLCGLIQSSLVVDRDGNKRFELH